MEGTFVKVSIKCPTQAELIRLHKMSRFPFLYFFHVISVHMI